MNSFKNYRYYIKVINITKNTVIKIYSINHNTELVGK